MTPLEKISNDLKIKLPAQLVDALLEHYQQIKKTFTLTAMSLRN